MKGPYKMPLKSFQPNFLSLSGKLRNSNLKLQKAIEPGNPLIFSFFPFDKKCLTYYIEIFIIKKKGLFFYDLKTNAELVFSVLSQGSIPTPLYVYFMYIIWSVASLYIWHSWNTFSPSVNVTILWVAQTILNPFFLSHPTSKPAGFFSPCLFCLLPLNVRSEEDDLVLFLFANKSSVSRQNRY